MESHRDIWLWVGGAMLLLAAVAAGIAGAFLATHKNFPFWTSGEMVAAYVLACLAVLCLVAAVKGVAFPPWSNGAGKASAAPLVAEISPSHEPALVAALVSARVIVDVEPEYLMRFYEEHMSIQAARLAEAYIGKWIRVSGDLNDVSPWNEYFSQVSFVNAGVIYMYFRDQAQVERLSLLRRGTRITVLGKLEKISQSHLELEQCELDEGTSA